MIKCTITLSILSILFACNQSKTEPAEEDAHQDQKSIVLTPEQRTSGAIEIDSPRIENIKEELTVNGVIDVPPQNIVSISFALGGYLKSTRLMPGMHVNKGEVIGVIEDQSLIQLQQDYLIAMTRLNFLQQDFERQRTLRESEVNAAKVFQQVQSDYESQKVLVKGFAEKLRLIGINPAKLNERTISRSVNIYSPINGFVSKVNVNIGKFVNPSDVLFDLINPDDMHAALNVFERDIAKVKVGQKVRVYFVDEPDKPYVCEVILVTRDVDADRSGTIHCHFLKMPKNLLPGMFINAVIAVSNSNALTVPEDAVVSISNKQFVFEEVSTNHFELREITPGATNDGRTAIIHSETSLSGKNIVTKSAYLLLSKMLNTSSEH